MSNNSSYRIWAFFWLIYRRYKSIYRPNGKFLFFFAFFPRATFYIRFCVGYISYLLIYWQYITDIGRYFLIFPSIDFRLLISCREGPTPEISMIYRDISIHDVRFLIFPNFIWSFVQRRPYKNSIQYIT